MDERPTLVKICGITNLADAELAVARGAWALGMIFYEGSPRRCSRGEAERIGAALRREVELCGVFVNATLDDVISASEDLGLSLLQLHGDEGPSYCAEVARRTGARVIKAVQVSDPGAIRDVQRFHVDFHLLDARPVQATNERLRGGTGETFDWNLAREHGGRVPVILSGGLNPLNVAEAIDRVHPYAVDTASGTEAAPGRKDPDKLRAFFDAVAASTQAPLEHEVGQPA